MSLSFSFSHLSTNFRTTSSSSIFKTLISPQSFSPISPFPPISKSFTIKSTPIRSSNPNQSLKTSPESQIPEISEQIPQKFQEIIKLFQSVQDPKAKYEQLLFYGKNLKPIDSKFKIDENKVKGCVSQVWLRAYFDDFDKKTVVFEADSDALITKGLAALLVQGLSGSTVQEILKISPDFILLLGLKQSLSPSRNNGFLNMFELMQKKALMLYVESEKKIESKTEFTEKPIKDFNPDQNLDKGITKSSDLDKGITKSSDLDSKTDSETVDSNSKSNGSILGNRGERIREILSKELQPFELEVEDVSYQHAGHAGVRGTNGETHFNLRIVSKEFEGKSLVKRHRLIYSLLDDELQSGLHALSIDAKTPNEVGV